MNIKKIKLTNFLSHVDTELDLTAPGSYLFVGENGAGKSSLVKDATTWALFGEARARGAGDDLIYNLEPKCKVELVFEVNEVTYRLLRVRERNKKTDLTLFKLENNLFKDISNVIVTKTQQDLENILGFSYRTFAVSACLEQNSKLNFSELTPKECKDTLMQILDIDKFNVYEKSVRDSITKLELEVRATEEKIEIANQNIQRYSATASDLCKLKEKQSGLVAQKSTIEHALEADRNTLKTRIGEIEHTIASRQVTLEQLRADYKAKDNESNVIAQTLTLAGTEVSKLTQRLLKIKNLGTKCPTCELEIAHTHLQNIIDEITKDLNDQIEIQKINTPKFKEIQDQLSKLETRGKEISVIELQKELKEATAVLSNLSTNPALNKITEEIITTEKEIIRLESNATNAADLQTEVLKGQQAIATIKAEIFDATILQAAFSKNGIPAMIISNITNELEFSINSILRELTTKNISVKVATEKTLKSKDALGDTLEIIIRNDTLERPYQLYSGGEKYRIDLAIRLAISKILARRNNFKLDTLIIDEPAGLDKLGLAQFKDAISRLTRSFKKILVISHLTELIEDTKGQFKLVTVKASNGISTVF